MALTKDNEDLVRVGRGTPMGGLMREYWIPALKSTELEAGGSPVRLLLLGEKLVAFREPSGAVGVMDSRCPHRGVSLFMGRVEEGGLRCVYHGWKFSAEGKCVDMPNVRPEDEFKNSVRVARYPVKEMAGVVWVYMGTRKVLPELPRLEVLNLPENEVDVICLQRKSNWLQNLEGEIDTSHFNFLHVGGLHADEVPDDHPLKYTAQVAPQYLVKETALGTCYAAQVPAEEDHTYTRFAHFLFPFWALIPQADIAQNILARAWVPMDDEHTMMFFFRWTGSKAKPLDTPLKSGSPMPGVTLTDMKYKENTTDWYGRWQPLGDESNDWLIDRDLQKVGRVFSGIYGIHAQDQAMTDSMGPIIDRGLEQLAPTDLMIVRTRRRILKALRAHEANGTPPPGVDEADQYFTPRSGYYLTPKSVDWETAYEQRIEGLVR